MDKIVVPQFLQIEDAILGPITVRQFLIMLVSGLLIFIFYRIFYFLTFIFSSVIVIAITVVLAFIRVNGQPFHFFLLNLIETIKRPHLRVWRRQVSVKEIKIESQRPTSKEEAPRFSRKNITPTRLSELALIVDTGGIYRGEDFSNQAGEK